MKCQLLLLLILLLFTVVPLSCESSTETILVDHRTFDVSLDSNATLTYVIIAFNVTVPPHNNGTFRVLYDNMIGGVVSERCYLKQFSIWVNERFIVSKQLIEDAQQCDLSLPFSELGAPNEYNGTLVLGGSSQGSRFRGTVTLSVSFEEPSNDGWFDWIPFGSNTLFFIIFFSCVGIPIIVLLIRRRRRGRREED